MKVYSPTDTERWLVCPQARDYGKRLRPRDHNWSPALGLGNAIHAALATHYGGDAHGAEGSLLTVLSEHYQDQDTWTLEALEKLALRGFKAVLKLDVVGGGEVVAVEKKIEECIPDLIHREHGGLIVTDWKVKFKLEKEWQDKALREYDVSWQLHHYAWRVAEKYGEHVRGMQVVIAALTPSVRAFIHPIAMPPERVENWLKTARKVWPQMSRKPYMRMGDACLKYGGCPFYNLCHYFHGDESAAGAFYESIHG